MGIGGSRRAVRANAQMAVTNSNSSSYKYPPKSEKYFSTHFIMGGERFENAKPDAYLFGENEDLNFLGSKPTPFPYPVPQPHEPTKTLKSLVNIRRDSLRLVNTDDSSGHDVSHTRYNIEFTFDADVRCAITIYYFAKEEINNKQANYRPRDPSLNSDTFHYKRGANQTFNQPSHFIDPSRFDEDDWKYNTDAEVIPIVIQCVVEEPEHTGHSHMTFAVVERSSFDGGFSLKALKQKQVVDGLCYLLQEIYGIENKNVQRARQLQDDDIEDNGSECVICMCETRDTLILPCRHLCLCNSCADNLRYQANNCPICRAKFHALLQIRAMHRRTTNSMTANNESADDSAVSQDGIPSGYEAISLIEALNGPTQPHCACSVPVAPSDGTVQSLNNASANAPASETTLQLEVTGVKEMTAGEESISLAKQKPASAEKDKEADNTLPTQEPSQEDGQCYYDLVIPISGDEDGDAPADSSYVTPLHESRVILRSPALPQTGTTSSEQPIDFNQDGCLLDDTRLQVTAGSSDESQYSSSSSTRDLLEHAQEETLDGIEIRGGVIGCEEGIDISEV